MSFQSTYASFWYKLQIIKCSTFTTIPSSPFFNIYYFQTVGSITLFLYLETDSFLLSWIHIHLSQASHTWPEEEFLFILVHINLPSFKSPFPCTKRYGPLRRPTSSSCGGLWPRLFLPFGQIFLAFYAVWPIFGKFVCPVVTLVTFSSNHSNFKGNPPPKKVQKNPKIKKIK